MAIWTTRNGWILKNEDPAVDVCKWKFINQFKLFYRAKKKILPHNRAVVGRLSPTPMIILTLHCNLNYLLSLINI
jgi:hypothetical protein